MSTGIEDGSNKDKYHVVSVDKTNPPEGESVGSWHRYVIKKGKSIIEGCKSGSLNSVTEHAKNVAEDINERAARFGRTTYYQVTWKRN